MAEQPLTDATNLTSAAPAAPVIDPTVKAEIDRQMSISLNGGMEPAAPAVTGAPAPAEPVAPATASDSFATIKEKFGYESPEAAIQEIEALRALKATPPAAELKFENEQSKHIAEALQAGNFQQVYDVLQQQVTIDRLTSGEMTAETAADIVKLNMQLKYKDLTPAEIEWKFKRQYGSPVKPALLPAEDQEEYNQRVAEWQNSVDDKQKELMFDAKLLKPELLASKTKLVFPSISRPEDADFQEWQKTVRENEALAAETTQVYKTFTPTSVTTKINFKDEANKIDFEFVEEPDPESFAEVMNMVTDINQLWQKFVSPDGKPDRGRFFKVLYHGLNHEKILMNAMNQAKNATIKASLPDNSTGGLLRQLPATPEPNALDTMMRASLKGYGGF